MYKIVVISLLIGLVVANRGSTEFKRHGGDKPSFRRVVKLQQAGTQKPSFCNRSECPVFTKLQDFGNFEERTYSPSVWVSTTSSGTDYRQAGRSMFWKLFRYIQGNNLEGKKIKMTAPVKTRMLPGQGQDNFTMSFFVTTNVSDTPQPIDDSVIIESIPEQTVYVKVFGGFARKYETWNNQALILAEELTQKNLLDFDTDFYYACGYNSPWKRTNRHNEVWFLKK